MAIASGTPVPPVYILEEKGINAFAAGYAPEDAVIGITRGAIEVLTRDQLQGVIAHEFSHILHGDMRINIRLIAILHGILVLGIIGYHVLRGSSRGRRSKESGGMVALGLGLVIVGYVGTFFGNLIKAAISRQREYLADASAVQFTRNPEGIGGALMQIANHNEGSYLLDTNAMEISHALFEEGVHTRLKSLYATHPPLDVRIQAILPDWDGSYGLLESASSNNSSIEGENEASDGAKNSANSRERVLEALSVTAATVLADKMFDHVGQAGSSELARARDILGEIPSGLIRAVHDPSAARAVIYLLVLDGDESARKVQLDYLSSAADIGIYDELQTLLDDYPSIEPKNRLPILYLALSSLRQISDAQYKLFKTNLDYLIKLDKKVKLFEWALQKIVLKTLGNVFEKQHRAAFGRKGLDQVNQALQVLFSVIAYSDGSAEPTARKAFSAAEVSLGVTLGELFPAQEIRLHVLDHALLQLKELKPLLIPRVLKACVACITADGCVDVTEIELLRTIGITLDCPIPLLTSEEIS
jgi:hypothetical protein